MFALMADTLDAAKPARRRRSDARRSIDAIISAARVVLSERPEASMEEIASTAGVTRQTVYAHFPTRDALIAALLHATAADIIATIDAAHLDTAPPADALRQFFDIIWQLVRSYPLLLDPALTRISPPAGDTVHRTAAARLERLIQAGQRAGDFDRTLSAPWLAIAILGLIHIATEQVAAGRFTIGEAAPMLLESALRLCGSAGGRDQPAAAPAADPVVSNATGDDRRS
jgi:AcrR family transcriptional regulator